MRRSIAERHEDRLVARCAARLIDEAREHVPAYAARRTVAAGTWQVSALFSAYSCHVTYAQLPEGVEGMVMPPVAGTFPIVLQANGRVDREIQERHELAHVIAGDVAEPTFLDDAEMTWTERVADLFALADVLPAGFVQSWRRRRRPWGQVLDEAEVFIRFYAPGWPAHRVTDRARLRLVLYRTQGI